MQRGFTQTKYRHGGDFATGVDAGVADVADQERIKTAFGRDLHVFHDFARLQVVEIMKLIGQTTAFGNAMDFDFGVRILDPIEDAPQRDVVMPPRLLARHALIPKFHDCSRLRRGSPISDEILAPGHWRTTVIPHDGGPVPTPHARAPGKTHHPCVPAMP